MKLAARRVAVRLTRSICGKQTQVRTQLRNVAKGLAIRRPQVEQSAAPPGLGHEARPRLRVPKAFADYIVLDILKQSSGTAVAVTDDEIMQSFQSWARDEGIFAAPEGAASLAAYNQLRASGFLKESDTVVLFNTGSGLKYIDVIAAYLKEKGGAPGGDEAGKPAGRAIGGIIQPY